MYRLLIADDEALEREGLEWMIARMMPGVFEIIHAENGRVAIQRIEQYRPDIVLMDIQMPGINGLEALKQIRANHPTMKIVIVTAYDYFSYAREALLLGAKEYILKPAKRDHMIAFLQKLVEELEAEKHKRESELRMTEKLLQVMPIVENELALMLMLDRSKHTRIAELTALLNIDLISAWVIVIAWNEEEQSGLNKVALDKWMHSVTSFIKSRASCIISPMINQHCAIFMLEDEVGMPIVHKLGEIMDKQFGDGMVMGIGTLQSGVDGIRQSYREAYTCCSQVDYHANTRLRRYIDLYPDTIAIDSFAANQDEVTFLIGSIKQDREQQTLSVIDRVRQWIAEHYQEDLFMESVAELVHLSPYYFSKMFKQHVGVTFIDYLTEIRIQKAKEWIDEGLLSLKEICYEVGYRDPNYFSRVFKKVVGITPTEYKQSKAL
ncbi:response regulator [Paenibacillus albiflavus]|uniref:Response regulator n=1 Tax=Paenibacillus albiflavus TaxID=2545760 RepID=A0A4R4E9C7_9BACL|nr:response regulator [Paenibacillus albiflavus]TCZ75787.1 response regulator [Paenibacillus albiflavus]